MNESNVHRSRDIKVYNIKNQRLPRTIIFSIKIYNDVINDTIIHSTLSKSNQCHHKAQALFIIAKKNQRNQRLFPVALYFSSFSMVITYVVTIDFSLI